VGLGLGPALVCTSRLSRATIPGRGLRRRFITERIWACTVSHSDDMATVTLSGEVDIAAREELRDILVTEVNRPWTACVQVDLASVTFLDSSGIAALVTAYGAAMAAGRQFTLLRARGRALRVLEITGLMPLLSAPDMGSGAERRLDQSWLIKD
jgi:anti-sigma B factor antagonist